MSALSRVTGGSVEMVGQVVGGGEGSPPDVEEGDACRRLGVDEGDARLGVGLGVGTQLRLSTSRLIKNRYTVAGPQSAVGGGALRRHRWTSSSWAQVELTECDALQTSTGHRFSCWE